MIVDCLSLSSAGMEETLVRAPERSHERQSRRTRVLSE